MSACVPARAADSDRTERAHPPHSPPPTGPRRFRIAGADLSASIAVFLIALPLSLGIALATGAPLQAGLVAAAVGGLVAGRLGGSPLQVSGPAAGLTVVTADIIQQYGWRTTCAVTVLAGLAQLGLGCLRVARGALAVSPAIVHGMLAGIGITIAVAQLHIVLGGTPQSSVPDNLRALPAQLANLHPAALSVSVLTLALLLLWPRLPGRVGRVARTVPAALVAVAGATAVAAAVGLVLPKVDLPSWRSHALAGLPDGPVLGLAAAVLTTTLVCSVQSLLGAVAVDKLASGRPGPARVGRSDLDRELLGQGAANIASGSLGGLPVAGVAVRSSANVHAGAVSRNSTMLHGVLVVIAALLMVPLLELIPLASLAALVMAVGIQMVSLHHIRTVTRHREVLVYAVTTLGVVSLGVLEGVALGIAAAVGVALHRLTRTRITHEEKEGVHHVRVRGQLTFLAVPRLSRALHLVPHGTDAVVALDGSFMDHAAYEALAGRGGPHGRDVWWHDLVERQSAEHTPEAFGAEHPLFILYTSGTTGKPKGILHTSGGYLTQTAYTHWAVFDLKPETDVYWCTADVGWVTGHSYIVYGPLANGATQVMYEGTPDTPHQGRFWEIVQKYGVTILYTAPTAIRTFMKWGDDIPAKFDLSSLRVLGSVGEPINPEAWIWYRKNIGADRTPVVDTWWQTETGGIMISPLPGVTDAKPGSAQTPLPGISATVVDDEANEVPNGGGGYLVLTEPWPSMLRTIWGDDQRFIDTYWSRFEGKYFAGDGAKKDDDGDIWLLGRVDDVMLVSGHNISTTEVESALVSHPSVAEAAVVGAADETTGQAIVAFVILRGTAAETEDLVADLRNHVGATLGPIAKPKRILPVAELPKTRSGKIMRRLLRDVAENRQLGDVTTLTDSTVMDLIQAKLPQAPSED
ncbi:Acetyl-coenzyme A synthetase [Streptomyces griseomycini]